MTQQTCEPIALVGSACRFPGGCDSPSKLWDVLRKPRDLARPIPKDRFNIGAFYHPEPTHHGTTNTRQAYFLDEDLSKFDAQFFGTPPSEVESMDPQQRLLMETVYDSLCAAGLPVESLRGSSTAVYVGIMCDDWSTMLNKNTDAIPTYTATGTARSIASNRISYFFDWHGASMTIDTACSSSLVAVHEAVRVLRTGESKVAVAAGANLILSPAQFVAESNLRMLSPTGRSRMWDASADGYVRGEGVAAVVLKTLSQALADGDPIECIIRETGVNQDGRTSGLTVPSNIAQTRLIRETYARAGLDLARVSDRPQFFHAHGTGTKAGDPQEAQAIHNAFFADFADEITHASEKLHVGSIKTIIGHTEGTAGLASLIGTSLAIRNNTIPPNMHFHTLNPTITPYYTHLQVPTVARKWPSLAPGAVKRASINSFGFGGTNAHAIVEEFVPESSLSSVLTSPALQPTLFTPLVFSAESAASLKSMLSDYHQYLTSHPRISLRNLSCTLRHRRSTLSHRKVIAGRDYDDVCDKIGEAINDSNANLETRSATVTNPAILGIFTGQGAQWPRMGAELLEASPFVARRIAEMDESLALLPEADRPQWTIKEQLLAEASSSRITEAALSQPLCTAIQVVMVDLMQAAGIRYKAVVGHSSGEIGAAYAAGLVSARDAIRIAYYRGLYAKLASSPSSNVKGAMAAVGMSHSEAEQLCDTEAFRDRICVAAYNSSSSLTLSGDEDAIDEAIGVLKTDSIFARRLKVDTAYHSPHMQTCAHHYLRSINQCGIVPSQPSEGRPKWYSSVEENALMTADSLNNQYWVNNMTQPVLFSSAIIAAAEATGSFDMAIEIGPHPALKGPAVDNLGELGITLPYTGLLSRGKDDVDELSAALGFIWENLGAGSVEFGNFDKTINQDGTSREVLTGLPNYPFNHQRSHWTKSRHSADHKQLNLPPNPVLGHPCVDTTTPSEAQWRNFLRPQEISWLQGHKLQGQIIFPATGYISMAVEALNLLAGEAGVALIKIHDLVFERAMAFNDDKSSIETLFSVKVSRSDAQSISATFGCHSCPEGDQSMARNASGRIEVTLGKPKEDSVPCLTSPDQFNMVDVNVDRFYSALARVGYHYAEPFKGMVSVQRKMGTARGTLKDQSGVDWEDGLIIHPGMLDTALQTIFAAFSYPGDESLRTLHVPVGIDSLIINPAFSSIQGRKQQDIGWASAIQDEDKTCIKADLQLLSDDDRNIFVQIEGVTLKPFAPVQDSDSLTMFSHFEYLEDRPNGDKAVLGHALDSEELQVAKDLERIAFYYLRRISEIPAKDRVSALPHHRHLMAWADHIVSQAQSGSHLSIEQKYLGDTQEDISALTDGYRDRVEAMLIESVGKGLPGAIMNKDKSLDGLMDNGLLDRFCNQGMNRNTTKWWLAGLTKQISHRYPHMKILEIGGRRGGITQAALSSLGTSFSSYTYTDVSSESLEAAEGAFKDYGDRMVFQVFDVTKSPTEQGLTAGSYDLVLASNTLTVAEDLDGSITNVRELLKPGGYLVGLETISNDILRNGIIMGCLPDWWLGAETGRPHGPMLDMQSWDALFRRCGFGGVETASPIQDDLNPVVVFAAQSQDDRIATLKSPSIALTDPFPASHPLLLIGGVSLNTWSLVDKIRSMLSTRFTSLKHVSSVEALTRETVPSGATVVSLTDLDEPLMKSLTESKMDGLKALWAQGRNVLWVTKNARFDEPYAYMMHGIGRVVRYENPNLNLQLLDVDSADDEVSQYIVDVLLRHQLLDNWRNAGTAGDLLWSSELELSLVEGKTLIPRLYPNKAQNARVNSARAAIFEDVDPATTAIKFVRSDSSAGLEAVTALESMAESSGDDAAKKKLRIKQSLLTSINLGEIGSLTLCIGVTDGESSSSAFLSLTDQSISPVLVDPSCILEIPAAPDFGKMALIGVATQLIAHRLLSSVPKGATLLVHEAEKPLQDAIRSKARTAGVAVVFTTCQSDKRSTDCTFLHPAIPKRLLSKHIPWEVTAFADFSTNDTPSGEIACAIQKLLPAYCLRMRSSTFFSNVQPKLRPGASLGEIEKVLKSAWTDAIAAGVSIGSISTIPLGDVSRITRETADQDPLTVIDWSVPTVPVRVRPIDHSNIFRPDRTYLLLGLSGEVGQSLCQWMVGKGARHVVLTSRKPVVDPDFIYSLQSKGADVRAMSLDLTSRESLMRCLDNIKRTMPKIAGITNGAMILADGPFAEMDLNDMSKVLKPKVDGSIMLDEIFHDDVLDFFIMFSSVTACFGNSGQSNYAAANMFMTSLTFQRRKRGVAASVIDLTSLMGIGHVGRSDVMDADYFRSLGVTSVCETDLHQIFAEAIHVGRPDSTDSAEIVTGVSPMSRSEIEKTKLQFRTDLKFSHLCIDHEASNQGQASAGLAVPLKTRLKNSRTRDEVTGILLESFIARIKTILQIPADEIISANDALVQRGVDSLIALDIRLWFMRELGVDMPVLRILSSQSILDLINDSMAKLPASIVDFDAVNGDSPVQSPAQDLESKQKIQVLGAKQPKSSSLPSSPSSSRRASTSDEDSENPSLCPMDTPILTSQDDTSSIEELGWRESIIMSSSEVSELMSFGQTGFWFLHHALEDKTTLNVSVSIRVTGLLQLDVLARALHDVADKHEAMRTRFFWSGVDSNVPTMGVLSQSLIQLEHRTISDKAEAAKALGDLQKHEWDLGDWESMRFVLLSLSEDVHWLVFGCHHITFDGASIQIMLADLFKAYSGQGLHRLPEESQYRTHSFLQRQQLEEGHFQKAINFYGNIIPSDVQPISLLPFSKQSSRQAQASHLAYSAQVCLSGSETARIKQMARQNQSTSFHLYLAALQAMLFRLLPDTSELFIGITDANRNDSQFAETLGLFLNLLPIRFDRPAAKAKFSSAIKATRRKVYAALEHASLPFDVLITELGISRSTTNTPPVFQVLVDYQQKTQEGPGFVGINAVAEASYDARTGYDISLHLLEKGEGDIVVTLQLQQSLYTQKQTDLLLRGYISFVKGLTKVSGREPLVDGPALWAEDDISLVLDLGKGPLNPLVWPETVSHRVSQMAVAHPSEPALKDGCGRAFSYAEMDCRVKSIAASLGKAGITKDDIVGILQEPSADWICSMLAIFHVGATYLPLDLRNSVHRLRNAVKAAKPAAILTDPTTIDAAGTIDAPDAKILDVSQIALESGSSETSTQASGDSAAVILFTSGSTGEPKGVVIKHSNLVAQNEGFSKQFNLVKDRRLRVLQQSAFSFDFSLEQIFFTLCNGGCLYVVSSEKRQDPYEVTKLILEEGINYTSATTSEYKNWLQYSQEHLQKCSQWEYALCSGEAFSIDLLGQFQDLQLPSLRLLTDYGPSETTISCTHQGWIDYTIDNQDFPLGVGSAAPNYSVYIVDHQLNLLPAGVPGEIMISGVGVSAGYLGQDDVTKDKFLPNPVRKVNPGLVAGQEHAIAYRSGDRGYLRDDGALVVEGRIDGDTQVKIRGFRVELAEIEEVLVNASKGALKHAIVTMRENSGDKFLAAHVVFSREDATDDRQKFLDNLQASLPLPDYMRPTVIMAVESLPLTAHSKANRRAAMALPIDAGMAATAREDDAAAGRLTPAEARLAELWKDVLPPVTTRAISSESNFFHVGGNSLLLVKLQKEIKQAFSTAPKLLDLMNASQLKDMAAVVTTASLARIDWLEETAIPSSWAVKFCAPTDQDTGRDANGKLNILLTGATGYLGRHLVPALIQSARVAKVVCLVRSESKVDDLSKASDKVVIVVGNLGEANLGLTEVEFERLSSEADVVVHCGANRSFWDGYEALRAANTNSVKELARLALPRRLPLHFLSSGSVRIYDGSGEGAAIYNMEQSAAVGKTPPEDGTDGYVASKWAAEAFLEAVAAQFQLPLTLHTPMPVPYHGPDDTRAAPETDEMLSELVDITRRLGVRPSMQGLGGWVDIMRTETIVNGILRCVLEDGGSRRELYAGSRRIDWQRFRRELETNAELSGLPTQDTLVWIGEAKKLGLSWFMPAHRLVVLSDQGDMVSRR